MIKLQATSAALSQVELAYCLAALADPTHHRRQASDLSAIWKALPASLRDQLTPLLRAVHWQGLITDPLLPEDWPLEATGDVVSARLNGLNEEILVSALAGWTMDEEDITLIRKDPDLCRQALPNADSTHVGW